MVLYIFNPAQESLPASSHLYCIDTYQILEDSCKTYEIYKTKIDTYTILVDSCRTYEIYGYDVPGVLPIEGRVCRPSEQA